SAATRVRVEVSACGAAVPSAVATASNPAPAVAEAVRFTAVVTDTDNDESCGANQQLAFEWSLRESPAGSTSALSGAAMSAPSLVPDLPGRYVVALQVVDSTGRRSAAS